MGIQVLALPHNVALAIILRSSLKGDARKVMLVKKSAESGGGSTVFAMKMLRKDHVVKRNQVWDKLPLTNSLQVE